jgi:Fe-S-cluster containining protein
VYVRNEEVSKLIQLNVPLTKIGDVTFIQRLPDGSCPMLDRVDKKCSIYNDRPQCCRLFPLDLILTEGHLRWAISNDCPDNRKLFTAKQGSDSKIGFGSISIITSGLDSLVCEEDFLFFHRKEQMSAGVEFVENTKIEWIYLQDCTKNSVSSIEAAKQGETDKEKLKRKLKEKERKKREREKREREKKKKKR